MRTLLPASPLLLVAACAGAPTSPPLESILTSEAIREDLRALAGDDMQGRQPGTPGGERAARYLAGRFQEIGLTSAAGGAFLQPVPMIGICPTGPPVLQFEAAGSSPRRSLQYRKEFVTWAGTDQAHIVVDRPEVIFAGYGIVAPEERWDDYAGVDVRDSIVLLLVNDPPTEEPGAFGGRALTYYGRWTYKLEEAARRGAAGALLIHTEKSAGYPWSVVDASWTGEQLYLRDATSAAGPPLQGWLSEETAADLARLGGQSLEELLAAAARRGFVARPLPIRMRAEIGSSVRPILAPNIVGRVQGSDPALAEECVVLTSHYDHLGIGHPVHGDSIYNGARDNASGVATMLAVAQAFTSVAPPPRRSVIVAAVTGEESGLLGSSHYADHPSCPLTRTVAAINLDSVNVWGLTNDIVALGAERSSLGEAVDAVARSMGMRVTPDPSPDKGFFYRSDQFSLARRGVPAVYLDVGIDFRDRPAEWGEHSEQAYSENDYHQPSDEYKAEWPLTGAAQMGEIAYRLGLRVANQDQPPRWRAGEPLERGRRE
jgi:Zn-dependent M28 family amino/carboxypeptidase